MIKASQMPKITIVTVCRNAAATIEKTIQSVLWQDYADYEYVVVDGMSTDETWSILQRYKERVPTLIHEPDTGIYNAMNKGILKSTGEVLVFLNADDYFASPYVLSRIARAFAANSEKDIIYGDYIWDTGSVQRACQQPNRLGRMFFLTHDFLLHQSMFCRRRAFEKVGLFDESFSIAGDTDWTLRALLVARLSSLRIPLTVCVFRQGGHSSRSLERLETESKRIKNQYFCWYERLFSLIVTCARKLYGRLVTLNFSVPLKLRRWLPG